MFLRLSMNVLIYILLTFFGYCSTIDIGDEQVEKYLDKKLTEFQLGLQNEFHIRRLARSTSGQTGIPFRSTVSSKECPVGLKLLPSTSNISVIDVTRNDQFQFVTYGTVGGEVVLHKTQDILTVTPITAVLQNLGDEVTHISTVKETQTTFFLAVAMKWRGNGYRLIVYRVENNLKISRLHSIDCEGIELAKIAMHNVAGRIFLFLGTRKNTIRDIPDGFLEVFHWRKHFDPVSNKLKNPIATNGVLDLAVWDYYGELRVAVLQGSVTKHGIQTKNSEISIYSMTSRINYADHASHYKVTFEQRIDLDFHSNSISYYFNTVQNLAVASTDPATSLFEVYTTPTKSSHFVYNNLQSPFNDGSGTFMLPVPHAYPDDLISVFDREESELKIFNQDNRLMYHLNDRIILSEKELLDVEILLLSKNVTAAEVLLLWIHPGSKLPDACTVQIEVQVLNKSDDVLVKCLKEVEELVDSKEVDTEYLKNSIGGVFVKDEDQLVIPSVFTIGSTTVSEITEIKNLIISATDDSLSSKTNGDVLRDLIDAKNQFSEAKSALENAVTKSGNQTINGTVTFQEDANVINFEANEVPVNTTLNAQDITRYLESALKIEGEQVIFAPIHLLNVKLNDNLNVSTLNDKNVEDLIQVNDMQSIIGNFIIDNDVDFENLDVSSVNGLRPEHLVLTRGEQVINGLKTFGEFNSSNIVVAKNTNERDLSAFAADVVTLKENHRIVGNFIIKNLSVNGDIHLDGLIGDEIDLADLAENILDKARDGQEINGNVIFDDVLLFTGNLTTTDVNGVIPEGLITLSTEQNITGDIVFLPEVAVLESLHPQLVNDKPPSVWIQNNQNVTTVTARKTFNNSMEVGSDILMSDFAKVDNVDPSELKSNCTEKTDRIDFTGPLNINSLEILENVTFIELNDCNVSEVAEAFWLKSLPQEIPVTVLTPPDVTLNSVESKAVNGFRLDEDYVHVDGNETITGSVTFQDDVNIDSNAEATENSTVNGRDVSHLSENVILKDGKNQKVLGPVSIENVVVVNGDVLVNSTVNGFRLSEDFLDRNSPQNITASIEFTHRVVETRYALIKAIYTPPNGTVNGIVLAELRNATVYVDDSRDVISDKVFTHLIVDGTTDILGTLNDVNVTDFFANVVTLSTGQFVEGQKIFTGHVHFRKEVLLKYLNGIAFTDYAERVVNKTKDATITGRKRINGGFSTDGDVHLKPNKTVENIDISEFEKVAMLGNKKQNVSGFIWFTDNVISDNLNLIIGNLDGIDPDDVALISDDATIDGRITFNDTLTINKNLTVEGLVQQCDLYALYVNGVRLYGEENQTIEGINFVDNLDVVNPGDIIFQPGRTANDVDVSELSLEVLKKNGTQHATGVFEFENLRVERLSLRNLLNGKNLTFFKEDAVLRDENLTIEAPKSFENIIFSTVHVTNNVTLNSTINEVLVTNLANETVFKDSNQTIVGKKTFDSFDALDVIVGGNLNGLNFTEDVWLINKTDDLPGTTTFNSNPFDSDPFDSDPFDDSEILLIILNDLDISGFTDGQNISRLAQDGVSLPRNQTVAPRLIFKDSVIVEGDCKVNETINNIEPEHIVKTTGNFEIDDIKTFNNVTTMNRNISLDSINDVDINNLSRTAVRADSSADITSVTVFDEATEFSDNLWMLGSLNDANIMHVSSDYYHAKNKVLGELDALVDRQYNHTEEEQYLLDAIEGQTVVPSHVKPVGGWKQQQVTEFYPTTAAHLSDQNFENPGRVKGYLPRKQCMISDCYCERTCVFFLMGPVVTVDYCSMSAMINICESQSSSDCVLVEFGPAVSSESCPGLNLRVTVTINETSSDLRLPKVTDGIAIFTPFGLTAVLATPTDGNIEYEAVVVRNLPVENGIAVVSKLEGSHGAAYVILIEKEGFGPKMYQVAVATRSSIMLYHYNEYNDKFEEIFIHPMKCRPSGLVAVKTYANETLLIASCHVDNYGFLYEEHGPNLLVFKTSVGHIELVSETYARQIFHISVMRYAGDIYVLATQTEDDKVVLYRLENHSLKETSIIIPITHPTSTMVSYHGSSVSDSTTPTRPPNNDVYIYVTNLAKVHVLKTVQYGNGVNLVSGTP